MTGLDVLYEDNHLLVVNKPAGIATMGTPSGLTIHSMAADYLKHKYNKPGKAYVGIVSRLDTMTSGALVLARTSKAAARLSEQFSNKSNRRVRKDYLAVVEGRVAPDRATLVDELVKDDRARRMRIIAEPTPGSVTAELHYQVASRDHDDSLLVVRTVTGRKHQIRVQFADRGFPIVGDRKYGASQTLLAGQYGIALHSWQLEFEHPTRRERLRFVAEIPDTWKRFGKLLADSSQMQAIVDSFGRQDDETGDGNS